LKTILFVTDLYYAAKGRVYYLEDLFLTEQVGALFAERRSLRAATQQTETTYH